MADLSRFTQKIFGSNAGTNQLAQYGSFAAGSSLRFDGTTITPTIVQALSNYLTGWFGASVGNNSPLEEDMNALCYLFAYQLTYLLQKGIPDWDVGTTYYADDYVKLSGTIYRSRTNSNVGNSPPDGTNWQAPLANAYFSTNVSVGDVVVPTGQTYWQPNLTISSGKTYTVDSGGFLLSVSTMIVSGILIINGTSRVL